MEASTAAALWKAEQSATDAHGPCRSPECPNLSCVSPGVEEGCVLESGVWRVDPERAQLLAVRRWPGAAGGRGSTAGRVYGGDLGCQGCEVPLLSGMQGTGPP